MSTKLARINHLSTTNKDMVFHQLMHHFDPKSLWHCYRLLDGKAAKGSDGITKAQYGEQLKDNLDQLVDRLKRLAYRPSPVKEVMIPKDGSKALRPLGISIFEDKVVQKRFQQVLEAIYEPLFLDCSYGFRPGRGCHDAIKGVRQHLYSEPTKVIIDLDLSNFFGTIDHDQLLSILCIKIQDKNFLRYIKRMCMAGVLGKDGFRVTDEGVAQGSVCSPVLANIFAHYVLDDWFENTVKQRCRGRVAMFRYADDAVICCQTEKDALRIYKALSLRLEKFGLALNKDKTKLIKWNKHNRKESGAFDFRGFTFYLGLTRQGVTIPKLKSSGKKIRSKLCNITQWCKKNRNRYRLAKLWHVFRRKLLGHVQYYGVSFNASSVDGFIKKAIFIFFKWINRRSQKRSMNYEQFVNYMNLFPPPRTYVVHKLY
jgi:RNA-directed DNA polymerase